jgi:azurin
MHARNETLTCALLLALASCGGDKTQPSAPAAQPAAETAQPSPAAQPSVVPAPAPGAAAPSNEPAKPDDAGIVHLTGSDQMRFSTTRIEVKAGQKVKIELKNAGALPKEVMGHDLVVLKPGSDVTGFAAKAMTAKATDYIPADASDQILAHTRLLGPGESQTIEFDVPGAGTYPFLCTFPGHVALMNGQLVVN